jgi:DNA mismatch endonuclease (patch repair protein)
MTKSEQMARVRSKDTAPEIVLRKALWKAGRRYRLRLKLLPGTPDLAFVSQKIAVFVDGCFWHGCPEHYTSPVRNAEFWKRKVERNMRRDRKADQDLAELGWIAIRIWEHEISQDLDAVVAKIERLTKDNP